MTDDAPTRAEFRAITTAAMAVTDKLAEVFGPVDVASVVAAQLVAIMNHAVGRDGAVAYLRDLADELEHAAEYDDPTVQ